jgi:hypothetical protein
MEKKKIETFEDLREMSRNTQATELSCMLSNQIQCLNESPK